MTATEAAEQIEKALRERTGIGYSVTTGCGTVQSWIEIDISVERRALPSAQAEREVLAREMGFAGWEGAILVAGTDAARRVIETGSRRVAPRGHGPRLIGELTDVRPFGVHRMALLGTPLVFALMVGGGVAVRAQMKPPEAPAPLAAKAPTAKAAAAPAKAPAVAEKPAIAEKPAVVALAAPAPAPKVVKTLTPEQRAARREALAAKAARAAPAPRAEDAPAPVAKPTTPVAAATGTVQLAILPWGEVFVDGRSRGVSPPLRAIEVAAGAHTIEVRNTSFPSHSQRVEVRPGEPVRIRHHFR